MNEAFKSFERKQISASHWTGIFTCQNWELYETSGIEPSFKTKFIFIRNVNDSFLMNFNHQDINVP
jgi:hypothetical protein